MSGASFIHISLVLGTALVSGCNDRPPETPEGAQGEYGDPASSTLGTGGYDSTVAPGAMTSDPVLGTAGTAPGGTVPPGSTTTGGMPGSTTPGAPLPGSGGGAAAGIGPGPGMGRTSGGSPGTGAR